MLPLIAPLAAIGDWAPSPEYIAAQSAPYFKDKQPEEIARFLAHPNGGPCGGAVLALAARGKSVLPLLEKLLHDTNPWIRAGAMETLAEMYKWDEAGKKGNKGKAEREMTPEISHAMKLAISLLDDRHPAVQEALGIFGDKVRIEIPETRKIAVQMAASGDPAVRGRALGMARAWLKDTDTILRVCTLVSGAPDGNTPGDWNIAHLLISQHSQDPLARQAIPVMAGFLRNKANTRPYRGFFSDGAQLNAMQVMKDNWDDGMEKIPDLVPGLCRSYVRVPHHNYKGWIKTRDLAWELLQKCTAASVPAIRATVAEEKQWLAETSDTLMQTTTETPPKEGRVKVQEFIGNLEKLADQLQGK